MKNLSVVLFAALFAALLANTVQASQNSVKFVAVDSSVESSLCVVAGQAGYSAARKEARSLQADNFYGVTCNGESLKSFAKSYQPVTAPSIEVTVKKINVVAADTKTESQICASAVKEGLQATSAAVNADISDIVCNGLRINRFVEKYSSL